MVSNGQQSVSCPRNPRVPQWPLGPLLLAAWAPRLARSIGPDPPGLIASDSHQPLCGLLLRATCRCFHSMRCFSRCPSWLAPHPGGLSLRVVSSEAPSPNNVLEVGPPIAFLICVVSHSCTTFSDPLSSLPSLSFFCPSASASPAETGFPGGRRPGRPGHHCASAPLYQPGPWQLFDACFLEKETPVSEVMITVLPGLGLSSQGQGA